MRIDIHSTICAIASGSEGAPRGIVRVTGPETLEHLAKLFVDHSEALVRMRVPSVLAGHLETPTLGEVPVAIHCWPGPRSYTGQPSAELHLIGAPIVLEAVQAMLLRSGLQLAQPGEFTLRAFLAGRLDLTQCEAVLAVIHAHGERAFRVALTQLAGGLSGPLQRMRTDLIELLADLEAGLDFVEEDITFVEAAELDRRLEGVAVRLGELRRQLEGRSGQKVAFQVALVGLPNAGKSSLVNAISGGEVAITSPVPGTTRDYVRSRLRGEGWEFDLLDTAGLENRDGEGLIAAAVDAAETPSVRAQWATQMQIQDADLVLYCSSVEEEGTAADRSMHAEVRSLATVDVWRVRTKIDCEVVSETDRAILSELPEYEVSSVTGVGVAELKTAVVGALRAQQALDHDAVPMTSQRCRDALARAADRIGEALAAARAGGGDEIVAGEIRLALDELGQVAGTVANDEILDALFSRFCIGK